MKGITIEYRYDSWVGGCGCCSYSSSDVEVFDTETGHLLTTFTMPLVGNEEELLKEFADCTGNTYTGCVITVSPDTIYF